MPPSNDKSETALGFAILAILAVAIYVLGSWVYHQFFPAHSVSLAVSAWFEPPAVEGAPRPLRVAGLVLEDGKPVTKDLLRISVEDWKKGVGQSVFLDVLNGHFDSGDQPSFRS